MTNDRRLWIETPTLLGRRLDLEPLAVTHAGEMARILTDPALHRFIGGSPSDVATLTETYRRLVAGAPDGSQQWLNWVVRRHEGGQAVGTTQATITSVDGAHVAEVAWVVATAYQRQGLATEAARLMTDWIRAQVTAPGSLTVLAHVHPEHEASQGVARAVGLVPGETGADGEVGWASR